MRLTIKNNENNKLFWRILLSAFLVFVFIGTANANINGQEINEKEKSQTIDFFRLASGQYIIKLRVNHLENLNFIIDTAATRTSLYSHISDRLKIKPSGNLSFINGITTSGFRPTSIVSELEFAEQKFFNHKIVILQSTQNKGEVIDGILGIDILSQLVLSFNHERGQVFVGKKPDIAKKQLRKWHKTRLKKNPYYGADFGLYFITSQLGQNSVPTLLDTGANFTAINWKAVKNTPIEKARRQLKKQWEIKGAIGEFKPRQYVRLDEVIIGGLELKSHIFLIMDFDNMPLNHYGKKPLAIAGIGIFEGRDFILDFPRRKLYVDKPER